MNRNPKTGWAKNKAHQQPTNNGLPFATFTEYISYTAGVDFIRYMADTNEERKTKDEDALDTYTAIQAIDDTLDGRKAETHTDPVSYAEGVSFGDFVIEVNGILTHMGLETLHTPTIKRAIADALNGRSLIPLNETYELMKYFLTDGIPAQSLSLAEEYLTAVKANPNIRTTESGLLYEITEQGDNSVMVESDTDSVKVNYVGTFKDGTIFDSNQDATFRVNWVIAGWAEGVKLVGKGGKIKIYLHPDLGYGERGTGNIPPNSVLIFDIELTDVTRDKHD